MSSPVPPSSTSGNTLRFQRANCDTIVPGDVTAWRHFMGQRRLDAPTAYAKALVMHRACEAGPRPGFRLYALGRNLACGIDVAPERGRHVIVGRHTQCDVVLPGDETVSLRHVLVRAALLDDGMPVLTVLDLDSATGFELSDGSQQRAIVATGPIVFRVGGHSLVALPCTGSSPDRLEPPQVVRVEASAYRVIGEPAGARPSHLPSRITIVPCSTQISAYRSAGARAVPAVPSNVRAYSIALESGGRHAAVIVTERDLEHGILLGRAPRCVDAGLHQILNMGVSRVHALLIREREGVFLYDIASSNGTYCQGWRIRCVALADHGTSLSLPGHVPLVLTWRALRGSHLT